MRYIKRLFSGGEPRDDEPAFEFIPAAQRYENFLAQHPLLQHVPRFNRHPIMPTGMYMRVMDSDYTPLTAEEKQSIREYAQNPVVQIFKNHNGEIVSFFFLDLISTPRERVEIMHHSGLTQTGYFQTRNWEYLKRDDFEFIRFSDLPDYLQAEVDLSVTYSHRIDNPHMRESES